MNFKKFMKMWALRRVQTRAQRLGTLLHLIGAGLGAHWTLGVFMLVAQASADISGPSTVFALLLAAVSASLAAFCHSELEASHPDLEPLVSKERPPSSRRHRSDLSSFLTSWYSLLAHTTALAACSRALSASMDYISGGRSQHWVQDNMGPLPHFMGGLLPDFVAMGVTAVPTILFVLGLERSNVLRGFLNLGVICSVIFLVSVGTVHSDADNWTGFLANGWTGLLTGAAICSCGFLGRHLIAAEGQAETKATRTLAHVFALLLALIAYSAVAVVVTTMVHFRELGGTPVPLLRVFEVRDVDWARLVMATLSIVCLALALLEICSGLHNLVVGLAGEQWLVFPRAMSREHVITGTPVLAILTSGCAASLLATLCPLAVLIKVMCVGPLLDQAMQAATVIHRRYQPAPSPEQKGAKSRNRVRKPATYPSKLRFRSEDDDTNGRRHRLTVRCLKSGLGFLQHVNAASPEPRTKQRYYTSLASPEEGHSSESLNVTYIDPRDISLVQDNLTRSLSNGTVVTSMSLDDESTTTNNARFPDNMDSLNSLRSLDSVSVNDQTAGVYSANLCNGSLTFTPSENGSLPNDLKYCQVSPGYVVGDAGERPRRFTTPLITPLAQRFQENQVAGNDAERRRKRGRLSLGSIRNGGFAAEDSSDFVDDLCYDDDEDLLIVKEEAGSARKGRTKRDRSVIGEEGELSLSSGSTTCTDPEASDSSVTDIDAVVAQYKQRVKSVKTVAEAQPTARVPTKATSRRVLLSLSALLVLATLVGTGTVMTGGANLWCSGLGLAGVLVLVSVIARQPQCGQHRLVPWVPTLAILLDMVLCSQLMVNVLPVAVVWSVTGCMLYCRSHGCWYRPRMSGSSRRERIRLHAPPRHSTVSTLVPSHRALGSESTRRLTRVDTILISR